MSSFPFRALKRPYGKLLSLFFLLFAGGLYWFYWAASDHHCIPVQIDDYWDCPLIQMKIGKKNYQMKLDVGAEVSSLNRQELRELDKQYRGIHVIFDALGNKHERSRYDVLGVKLHKFKVPRMEVCENTPEVILVGNPEKVSYCGYIGRKSFGGKNFLMDFDALKIIVCDKFTDLANDGYDIKNFIEVPFEASTCGICFRVETELGEKTLYLDAGCSHSCLRSPQEKESLSIDTSRSLPIWRNQKFVLAGHEFGPKSFVLIDIPLTDKIDGNLGMDFLKKHPVYIDTKRSTAYIQKSPAKPSPT